MTHRRLVVIGLAAFAALAACAPRTRPTAPSPASSATAPAPEPDTAPAVDAAKVGEASARAVARQADSIRVSVTDVTRQAVQVFGDSVVRDSSADAMGDVDDDSEAPSWDMDVQSYLSQDRVEHFVRMFSGSARDRIAIRLERGTRYEPMIRQQFREGGLPEDMYYLALVESGFDPHAYSRAAAVGMWQFMTSTGRWMGLRTDWWVDERRDPVRSTAAAVRFIRGLRDQFGSLYLAAAAYNGGPGRVARGLKRFEDELEGQEGEDLFFALAEQDYLRKETKDYVPQLIAAALVAKDPQRYGLTFKTLPPFAYDSVRVGPESAVPAIARAAGVSVAAIQDLNPHLLRGMTPPRTEWTVRIPVGTRARFESAWAELDRDERTGLRRAVTRKGGSLEAIAADHGVSVRQLLAFNPGGVKRSRKGRLVVGQTVLVPTASVAAAALVVPDPEIERYGSSAGARGKSRGSATEMHVVRRGETL
ncbi:MAG TPA: transglycosylase SLT domain-containing protein, partial [Gemmatimonadaceae bacterium]|nr:transglycosylase SLT domain-containing protein [Gemmatimonadaceae bacterium]